MPDRATGSAADGAPLPVSGHLGSSGRLCAGANARRMPSRNPESVNDYRAATRFGWEVSDGYEFSQTVDRCRQSGLGCVVQLHACVRAREARIKWDAVSLVPDEEPYELGGDRRLQIDVDKVGARARCVETRSSKRGLLCRGVAASPSYRRSAKERPAMRCNASIPRRLLCQPCKVLDCS